MCVDERFISSPSLFKNDIALFSNFIAEAEAMLAELNDAGKRVELPIHQRKTLLLKNVYCAGEGIQLEGYQLTNIFLPCVPRMFDKHGEQQEKYKLNRRRRAA